MDGERYASDARIAAAMQADRPVLLVSADGRNAMGANAYGKALLGRTGALPATVSSRLARIFGALPRGAGPRLDRLNIGPSAFEPLLCRCTRLDLPGERLLLVEVMRVPRGLRPVADTPPAVVPAPAQVTPPAPVMPAAPVAAPPAITMPEPPAPVAEEPRAIESSPAPAPEPPPASAQQPVVPPAPESPVAPEKPAENLPPTLRFIFETDSEGRVTFVSPDQREVLGPAAARLVGRVWAEAAAELGLDEEGEVARALSRRETWSGLSIAWPFASGLREDVELSAIPVFDDGGRFSGFRGLGVHRGEHHARIVRPDESPPPGKIIDFEARTGVRSEKPALSPVERSAFREIARALNARPDGSAALADPAELPEVAGEAETQPSSTDGWRRRAASLAAILDRIPAGTLVRRGNEILAANRRMLEIAGVRDLAGLAGIDLPAGSGARPVCLRTPTGQMIPVDAVLHRIDWDGAPASLLVVTADKADGAISETELAAILDLGGDGIVIVDAEGLIRHMSASAASLFGFGNEVIGAPFTLLLSAESRLAALDGLEDARRGEPSRFNEATSPLLGLGRRGNHIMLLMKAGRLPGTDNVALLFRDISAFRESEQRLVAAREKSDEASAQKSDFLAKISHEIRTPLNAIIGFAEVIGEERFGPIGTPRYREYLQDIRRSGEHVLSLVNDLLDLSKIEAGRLDLTFTAAQLNDIVQQCVAIMQPQSAARQIIVRASLSAAVPQIIADQRSLRQIVLNLLSNAVKFSPSGSQVIVATLMGEDGSALLRVRDTGRGMSDSEILTAMQPFRQIGPTEPGGTGLGLPLTRALAEANHARFAISSRAGEGTVVEIAFPPERLLTR